MDQVALTIFEHSPQTLTYIRSLLIQFEQYHQIHVRLTLIPRPTARKTLLEMAFNQAESDVVELDAAWLSEFAGLGALQSLSHRDLRFLEAQDQFIRASWQSCQVVTSRGALLTWAVPWFADTGCIFYRRDLLENAGIDPNTAFDSLDHFEKTIAKLTQQGMRIPLALPTNTPRANLRNLVMWVWGSGGELMDASGIRPMLDQPLAMHGLHAYYHLGEYLASDARHLDQLQAEEIFSSGFAAVLISSPWMLQDSRLKPKLNQSVAVAIIPGSPCVSSHQLGIWKEAKNRQAAMQLVKFLTSRQAAELLHPHIGLPVRHDILETARFISDPRYHVIADSLRAGRSFPTGGMATVLHKQLYKHATEIWEALFNTPRPVLNEIISRHVGEINHHFEALNTER